ncbi:MAG: phenylalanine--tRNA ligase subunit beta [Bacteroidota bacterium]
MQISLNWLSDYIDLSALTPDAISDMLTMVGLEVDSMETVGPTLDGVVVGHVLERTQHPNADKLSLCQVDLGEGEPVQIVCGAPNVDAGQKVPVATVGTTLMLPDRKTGEPVPVTLKKAKLRGEVSNGMICAEDELGLGDDHDGIMVLDADAPIGQTMEDYLRGQGRTLNDTVYDIAITPNRPDAVSHIGVARDLAALTEQSVRRPDVNLPEAGGAAAERVTVKLVSPEACPRYVALLVRGVTIQESPDWLKDRLTAIGLRPINNVVDVTNYVMYECGQPLHAFDADQIAGDTIIVEQTTAPETFVTLDSQERTLPVGTLMICDAERRVAVAGVMGGENSEVTDVTTNVLIESAYFDPSLIRKTAKALGLQTDASYRFERGIDRDGQVWAAARAADLIAELGGGMRVDGMVDAHPVLPKPLVLTLRLSRIETILGVAISHADTVRLLTAIGFGVEDAAPGTLSVTVPLFRPDVEREIDLIEEVARLYGYDNIPEPKRTPVPNKPPQIAAIEVLRPMVRTRLAGLGFREVCTNSMQRAETAALFAGSDLHSGESVEIVETLNPISQEMAALRPSLLPGVLQVMSYNQNRGQRQLHLMEFGHIMHRADPKRSTLVPGYNEYEALILAMSGTAPGRWNQEARALDVYDVKGAVEWLLELLRIEGRIRFEATPTPGEVTSYRLDLRVKKRHVGVVACVADAVADTFALRDPVYFAELDWAALVELAAPQFDRDAETVSRFPSVERDLAVAVNRDQPVGPMLDVIRQFGRPLIQDVAVFDVYQGERIASDQKSVAFALRFGADRTLKDKEVDKRIRTIVQRLGKEFGATLRG